MKKLLFVLLTIISVSTYAQIAKTGGILYSNGNPNTKGLDTLTLKNLNRNSEVAVDISNGSLHVFNRADSTYVPVKTTLFETLTLPQFQSSVVYKTLVPGTVYKITGVHKNKPGFYIEKLYDDGTNSGITIYLTALSNSTFTNSGYGEFYNPKYQPVSNYDNNDKTGMWGIWDTSVTYATNDRAIWGGYMWSSVAGGDGTATDEFTLSADWVKLPYSDTSAYKKVIDYIEYDFENDFITRRKDEIGNIDVEYKLRGASAENGDFYGIKAMQWGNYIPSADLSASGIVGTTGIKVETDSYFECVNFKGVGNFSNYFKANSFSYNNKFLRNSGFYFNTLIKSSFSSNFLKNSYINNNDLKNSIISDNLLLTGVNTISYNSLINGQITGNILTNSNIIYNTITSSIIGSNTLTTNSNIQYNSIINGGVSNNSVTVGHISNNVLFSSIIVDNTLSNSSSIENNTLTLSTLNFSTSGTISSKVIKKITANDVEIISNISAATTIFGNFPKNIYKRQDNTVRMSYYNNNDTLLIVNVNN